MSDGISNMYDNYEDYKHICKVNKINPVGVYNVFYSHEDKILKDLGFKNKHEYYKHLRKVEERDKKINKILNEREM